MLNIPKNKPDIVAKYQFFDFKAIKALTRKHTNNASDISFDFLSTESGISFNFSRI